MISVTGAGTRTGLAARLSHGQDGGMEHMVAVAGGEVWADDTGRDEPALALLHPAIGDSRVWDLVVPQLVDRFRLIRYDSRGFGRSPHPTEPSHCSGTWWPYSIISA